MKNLLPKRLRRKKKQGEGKGKMSKFAVGTVLRRALSNDSGKEVSPTEAATATNGVGVGNGPQILSGTGTGTGTTGNHGNTTAGAVNRLKGVTLSPFRRRKKGKKRNKLADGDAESSFPDIDSNIDMAGTKSHGTDPATKSSNNNSNAAAGRAEQSTHPVPSPSPNSSMSTEPATNTNPANRNATRAPAGILNNTAPWANRTNNSSDKLNAEFLSYKSYSAIPMLETTQLPRGGFSMETEAVGRVQVRVFCFNSKKCTYQPLCV